MTFFSLALSRVRSAFRVKRERRLTPSNFASSAGVPSLGASPSGGGEGWGVVEVDGVVAGEVRVEADALEALFVVGVDGDGADDGGVAGGVGAAEFAVAGGVQDAAVGEYGEGHGFADFCGALGEGDLLEVLGSGSGSRGGSGGVRVGGVAGGGAEGEGGEGEQAAGEQGEGLPQEGASGERGPGAGPSLCVHECPPGRGAGRTGFSVPLGARGGVGAVVSGGGRAPSRRPGRHSRRVTSCTHQVRLGP